MKKSLLAVAVAAALPAAAFAQTNVTLYGILDAGVGMNDPDGPGSKSSMVVNSGYQSTSRWGIRGAEDLGGGLRATFNIEAGLDVDTGTDDGGANYFQRRAVVGLAGGWGEVRLGRDYTPGFSAAGAGDVMGYGLLGTWLTYTAGAGGIQTRASNGIHYTGSFSGITVRAMYAEGEGTTSATKDSNDAYGLSAVYAGGPMTLLGYYQVVNDATGNETEQMGVGGGWNFGGFRVLVNYGMADVDGGPETTGLALGVGLNLGAGELRAQAMQIERDAVGGGTDPKATVFGIAYLHPLSKRTNLYATYGMARNNSTGTFGVFASDNAIAPSAAGADPSGFAVGVRHVF
jgi:predicted porin